MQLESLEVYCDVARLRSFSQAAAARGITQSAVSQVVSQLEHRLEVQLIDRSTRPLQLTALGQSYYDGCKSLLEEFGELESSIRSQRAAVAGTVEVAAIYSVGLVDMGDYVQRLTAGQPEAQVHIEYHHPDKVYEHVIDGTADLGLVSFPRKSPKLTALPWRDEEMVLACSPRHPLAELLTLPVKELAGQTFVHFARELEIRRRVDQFLRAQRVAVDVVLEFDNIENIKQAVAIGAGVALLPEPTIRRECKARTLVGLPLHGAHLTRPLGIIHRRGRLSGAAGRFVELLLGHEFAEPRRTDSVGPFAGGNVHSPTPKEAARNRNGHARTAKRTGS